VHLRNDGPIVGSWAERASSLLLQSELGQSVVTRSIAESHIQSAGKTLCYSCDDECLVRWVISKLGYYGAYDEPSRRLPRSKGGGDMVLLSAGR
jgi:hypothetical protein